MEGQIMKIRLIRLFVVALFTLALLGVGTPARAQGGWQAKTPMPAAEHAYGYGVGAVNGTVYVAGGNVFNSPIILATVWAYDPRTDSWTEVAPMPTARIYPSLAAVDGILYAVGGCLDYACGIPVTTVEAYDPRTDTWTEKAPMLTPRRQFPLVSADGTLYAMGGMQGPGCSFTTSAEAYNPSTNVWTELAPLPMDKHYGAGGGHRRQDLHRRRL
jgi:N-acetylneuraminic acid mutarotase